MDARPLLEQLEAGLGAGGEETYAPLAFLAAHAVDFDAGELSAARRRAMLLLASGGDPRRDLEPGSRAVSSLASDLDEDGRRMQLRSALEQLRTQAEGLPAVGAALERLVGDDELAWRSLALALLAEELSGGDDE